MTSTVTRIYLVTCEGGLNEPVLVRAKNRHVALRHVIGQRYNTRLATQEDLEEYLQMGLRVQVAGDEDDFEDRDPNQLDLDVETREPAPFA